MKISFVRLRLTSLIFNLYFNHLHKTFYTTEFYLLDEDYFYVASSYKNLDFVLASYIPSIQTNSFEASSGYSTSLGVACNSEKLPVQYWTTWDDQPCSVQDAAITQNFAYSGSQSILITKNDDIVRDLFNLKSGKWYINFKVYLPSNSPGGQFGVFSKFESSSSYQEGMTFQFMSNGIAHLFTGDQGPIKSFSYSKGNWYQVLLVVNLDTDNAEFYFGNAATVNQLHKWQWSLGGSIEKQLAVITFYNFYQEYMYVDDFYFGNVAPDVITSVEDEDFNENKPTDFTLLQNFPNPFNPTTSIEYSVPSSEYVSLKVYDILGNEVAQLVNENKNAGKYEVKFDASNLTSGLYIYKIQAGSFNQVRKMMLIK